MGVLHRVVQEVEHRRDQLTPVAVDLDGRRDVDADLDPGLLRRGGDPALRLGRRPPRDGHAVELGVVAELDPAELEQVVDGAARPGRPRRSSARPVVAPPRGRARRGSSRRAGRALRSGSSARGRCWRRSHDEPSRSASAAIGPRRPRRRPGGPSPTNGDAVTTNDSAGGPKRSTVRRTERPARQRLVRTAPRWPRRPAPDRPRACANCSAARFRNRTSPSASPRTTPYSMRSTASRSRARRSRSTDGSSTGSVDSAIGIAGHVRPRSGQWCGGGGSTCEVDRECRGDEVRRPPRITTATITCGRRGDWPMDPGGSVVRPRAQVVSRPSSGPGRSVRLLSAGSGAADGRRRCAPGDQPVTM